MTTRNLYEIDTVIATLLYAIEIGNKCLAIQTTKELVISEESGHAQRALTLAWWLSEPTDIRITTEMSPKELLYGLIGIKHPIPTKFSPSDIDPPKAGTHIMPPPRSWKKLPTGWTPHMAGRLWLALQYDIRQKFPLHMTDLVRPLLVKDKSTVISLLTALNVPKFYIDSLSTVQAPLNERILYHSFATLTNSVKLIPEMPQWDSLWNEAYGRCFSIEPEALGRWNVKSKPKDDLLGAPVFVMRHPSKFWQMQIKQHQVVLSSNNTLIFPNDDLHESFYTNFPNDIPDEWSIAERQKSHGIIIPQCEISPWLSFFNYYQ